MKHIFLLFYLFLTSISLAQTHHHTKPDHPSIHGMLMIGQSKIYLSHLPMFHSPHDYQVIFEAQISEPAKEIYLNSLASANETVYTLVPEAFVLPEMVKSPRPFKAQIYKGHFERGGTLIAANVTVNIQRVIFFKKFSAAESKPEQASFILFGNKDEQFLAHHICTAPDFDQISKVSVPAPVAAIVADENARLVQLKAHPNADPLVVANGLQANLQTEAESFSLNLLQVLYFETGDLSF